MAPEASMRALAIALFAPLLAVGPAAAQAPPAPSTPVPNPDSSHAAALNDPPAPTTTFSAYLVPQGLTPLGQPSTRAEARARNRGCRSCRCRWLRGLYTDKPEYLSM